jgi:Zn-dependent peptidase ImmA (M78 family)
MVEKFKKFGFTEVYIRMGLFEYTVVAVIGNGKNLSKYRDWKFDEKGSEIETNDSQGLCLYKRGYIPIIWIPRKPKTPREYATLAHECGHAVKHLFNWAGMQHSEDNDEVYTHSLSHLITNVLEQLSTR